MINKRRFLINAAFVGFQAAFSLIIYYFLYTFLLGHLGIQQLGVWSIVLVVSSTASIANLGIGSSVVRFTAVFTHKNELESLSRLLYVSSTLIGGIFLLVGVLAYVVLPYWLDLIVGSEFVELARSIVPYSVISLWLNALSNSVFLSCLEGMQKTYLRSSLNIVGSLILLQLSVYFVPSLGLLGAAIAQTLQAVVVLSLSVLAVKAVCRPLKVTWQWDATISRQLLRLGAREQIISVSLVSLEPITRSFLTLWGGLEFAAYYELANRLAMQVKSMLVSLNQLMLPIYSVGVDSKLPFNETLRRNFRLNFITALAAFSALTCASVLISYIVFGFLNQLFVFCVSVLCFGYFLNVLSVPPYLYNISSGSLKSNVVGSLIIFGLNIILCFVLGWVFSGYGVVLGWAVALAIGSLYIVHRYMRRVNVGVRSLIGDQHTLVVLGAAVTYVLVTISAALYAQLGAFHMVAVVLLGFVCFVGYPLLVHSDVRHLLLMAKGKSVVVAGNTC